MITHESASGLSHITSTETASSLIEWFRDVVEPEICLSNQGEIYISPSCTIQIGKGGRLMHLLASPNRFNEHSRAFQTSMFDVLFILLKRSIYDVIRLQLFESVHEITDDNGDDSSRIVRDDNFSNNSNNNSRNSSFYLSREENVKVKSPVVSVASSPTVSVSKLAVTINGASSSSSALSPRKMSPTQAAFDSILDITCDSDILFGDNKDQFPSFSTILVNLLVHISDDDDNYIVSIRILRLLGIVMPIGVSSHNLKILLSMLGSPSKLTVPILQCLKLSLKASDSISNINRKESSKAFPTSFFNFGGIGSGLFSVLGPAWFTTDYQIALWFRVEQFDSTGTGSSRKSGSSQAGADDGKGEDGKNANFDYKASIVCITSPEYTLELYLDADHYLVYALTDHKAADVTRFTLKNFSPADVTDSSHSSTSGGNNRSPQFSPSSPVHANNTNNHGIEINQKHGIKRQVWYHVHIKHHKAKFSLLGGQDELFIYIDHQLYCQKHVKIPATAHTTLSENTIGKDFNGQIAAVYLNNEILPNSAIEIISQTDSGQISRQDLLNTYHGNSVFPDLCTTLFTANHERRSIAINSKIAVCYHPLRCAYGHALDIHSDKHNVNKQLRQARHARFGLCSFPTQVFALKDSLDTLGGVEVIVNLFPRLLIDNNDDNDQQQQQPTRDGFLCKYVEFGRSFADLVAESIHEKVISDFNYFDLECTDCNRDAPVSLLFTVLGLVCKDRKNYQKQLIETEGVKMISYILMNLSPHVFLLEKPQNCIVSLLKFQTSISENVYLLNLVTKDILCNMRIWSKCNFEFQSALLSVLTTDAMKRSDYYLSCVGVQEFVDFLFTIYLDNISVTSSSGASGTSSAAAVTSLLVTPLPAATLTPIAEAGPDTWRSTGTDKFTPVSAGDASRLVATKQISSNQSSRSDAVHLTTPKSPHQITQFSINPSDDDPQSPMLFLTPLQTPYPSEKIDIIEDAELAAFDLDKANQSGMKRSVTFGDSSSFSAEALSPLSPVALGNNTIAISPSSDRSSSSGGDHVAAEADETEQSYESTDTDLSADAANAVRALLVNSSMHNRSFNNRSSVKLVKMLSEHSVVTDLGAGLGLNLDLGTDISSSHMNTTDSNRSTKLDIQLGDVSPTNFPSSSSPSSITGFALQAISEISTGCVTSALSSSVLDLSTSPSTTAAHTVTADLTPHMRSGGKAAIAVEGSALSVTSAAATAAIPSVPIKSESLKYRQMSRELPYATMTRRQKQRLRSGIQLVILILIRYSSNGSSEIKKLLPFLARCQDAKVLDEVIQLVLCLIVDGGERFVVALTEACGGVDEFSAYVLTSLVNHRVEEIRCGGIRLLTHFHLRIHTLNSNTLNMTIRTNKNSIFARTIDKFTASIGDDPVFMQRFMVSGGLALVYELVVNYMNQNGILTYSSLLEMLLIKTTSTAQSTHIGIEQFLRVSENTMVLTDGFGIGSPADTDFSFNTNATSLESRNTPSGLDHSFSQGNINILCSPRIQTKLGNEKTVDFAVQYLRPYNTTDHEDLVNTVVLPVFFTVLPKFNFVVQNQILGDLLALTKFSSQNRESLCNIVVYQCLFKLILQVIQPNHEMYELSSVTTSDIVSTLEVWSRSYNLKYSNFGSVASVVSSDRAASSSPLSFVSPVKNPQSLSSLVITPTVSNKLRVLSESKAQLTHSPSVNYRKLVKSWKSLYHETTSHHLDTEEETDQLSGESSSTSGAVIAAGSATSDCNVDDGMNAKASNSRGSADALSRAAFTEQKSQYKVSQLPDPNVCFSVGLKSFSILLHHMVQHQTNGWYEVLKAISPLTNADFASFCSQSTGTGAKSPRSNDNRIILSSTDKLNKVPSLFSAHYVSRAVLSHLAYEMTNCMKNTYAYFKDQSSKLKNNKKKRDALQDTLENHLFIMILCSQFALQNIAVVPSCVPDYNIGLLRRRLQDREIALSESAHVGPGKGSLVSDIHSNMSMYHVEEMLLKQLFPLTTLPSVSPPLGPDSHSQANTSVDAGTIFDNARPTSTGSAFSNYNASDSQQYVVGADSHSPSTSGNGQPLSPKDILESDDIVSKDTVLDNEHTPKYSSECHQTHEVHMLSTQHRSLAASKYFDESAQVVRQASSNTLINRNERQEDRHVLFSLANVSVGANSAASSASSAYGLTQDSQLETDNHVSAIWLDLKHTWHSLSPILESELPYVHMDSQRRPMTTTSDKHQPQPSKFSIHQPNATASSSAKSTRSAAFFCNQLEPLQRTAGLDDGKMLFILQNLRLFDSFFWPVITARIRSGHMLFRVHRFSPAHITRANSSGNSSVENRDENDSFDRRQSSERKLCTMPLYYHIYRSVIYTLQHLSPFHNLATVNMLRLRALLRPLSPAIVASSLPVKDLILLSLCHILTCLQRINFSLASVFQRLGLLSDDSGSSRNTSPVNTTHRPANVRTATAHDHSAATSASYVKVAGFLSEQDEQKQHKQIVHESIFFEQLKVDMHKLSFLSSLFNSRPGTHLLDFIRACLGYFVDLIHNPVCQKSLKSVLHQEVYDNLYFFYEKINISREADHLDAVSRKQSRANTRKNSLSNSSRPVTPNMKATAGGGGGQPVTAAGIDLLSTTAPALGGALSLSSLNRQLLLSNHLSKTAVESSEDILSISSSIREHTLSDINSDVSSEDSPFRHRLQQPDDDVHDQSYDPDESDEELDASGEDDDTENQPEGNESDRSSDDSIDALHAYDLPQSVPVTPRSSRTAKNVEKPNELSNLTIFGILRLLRDPFVLFTNLMRCEEVVQSLSQLETVEMDVAFTFAMDLDIVKEQIVYTTGSGTGGSASNAASGSQRSNPSPNPRGASSTVNSNNLATVISSHGQSYTGINSSSSSGSSSVGNLFSRYSEEAASLKELSKLVLSNMLMKERVRIDSQKQFDQAQLSYISGKWRNSFRLFDSERSPWYNPLDEEDYDPHSGALITTGVTRSEYSRLYCDSLCYRRILLKTDHIRDYRFSKYHRRRMSFNKLSLSMSSNSKEMSEAPKLDSNVSDTSVLRSKMSKNLRSSSSTSSLLSVQPGAASSQKSVHAASQPSLRRPAGISSSGITATNKAATRREILYHNSNPNSLPLSSSRLQKHGNNWLKEVNSNFNEVHASVNATSWGENYEDDNKMDSGAASATAGARNQLKSPTTLMSLPWMKVFPNPASTLAPTAQGGSSITTNHADEKIVFMSENATTISLECRILCDLVLTSRYLYCRPKVQLSHAHSAHHSKHLKSDPIAAASALSSVSNSALKMKEWLEAKRFQVDRIINISGRRQNFKNCAIEIYFIDSSEIFIVFETFAELRSFYISLKKQYMPLLAPAVQSVSTLDPKQVFLKSPFTDQWRKRQISNYEYLMRLNLGSSRSFNDICQYPVFPWILSDYTSSVLDLSNPSVYRDLSKPIGALDSTRLQMSLERYNSFDTATEIPFLYGSHYSTEGVVVHYLIRQEPFTSLALKLQDGRFDVPDRLFFDIAATWDGCSRLGSNDVKELVPELFTSPEFLLNTNRLPLGELQEGANRLVDDVILPPWCHNSAHDFIRIHRDALESEYVSENLHRWIDLIFGYKQTGKEARAADNVFHYLTYEGALDIEKIHDKRERQEFLAYIQIGQTPSQLFVKPHPRRQTREECGQTPLLHQSSFEYLSRLAYAAPRHQVNAAGAVAVSHSNATTGVTTGNITGNAKTGVHGTIISMTNTADRLVVMNSDLTVVYYKWSHYSDSDSKLPFCIRLDRAKVLPSFEIACSEDVLRRQGFVPLVNTSAYDADICYYHTLAGARTFKKSEIQRSKALPTSRHHPRRNQFYSADLEVLLPGVTCTTAATGMAGSRSHSPVNLSVTHSRPSSSASDSRQQQQGSGRVSGVELFQGPCLDDSSRPPTVTATATEVINNSNKRISPLRFLSSRQQSPVRLASSAVMSPSTSHSVGSSSARVTTSNSFYGFLFGSSSSSVSSSSSNLSSVASAANSPIRNKLVTTTASVHTGKLEVSVEKVVALTSASAPPVINSLSISGNSYNSPIKSMFSPSTAASLPERTAMSPLALPVLASDPAGALLSPRSFVLENYIIDTHHQLYDPHLASTLPTMHSSNVAVLMSETGSSTSLTGTVGIIGNTNRIISCGYWDNLLRIHSLDTLKDLTSTIHSSSNQTHNNICQSNVGVTTCIKSHPINSSNGGGHLVFTGNLEGLCRVYVVDNPAFAHALLSHSTTVATTPTHSTTTAHASTASTLPINSSSSQFMKSETDVSMICVYTLWGHTSPVMCLSYSHDSQLLVSASSDGVLCIHSVMSGQYIRSIDSCYGQSVDSMTLTVNGYLIVQTHVRSSAGSSAVECRLHSFWVNGTHLKTVVVPHCIEAMVCSGGCAAVLVCGDQVGDLTYRDLSTLDAIHTVSRMRVCGAITWLSFSADGQYLFIGSQDGTFTMGFDPCAAKH